MASSVFSDSLPNHSVSSSSIYVATKRWEALPPITDIRVSLSASERVPPGYATCRMLGEVGSASRLPFRLFIERQAGKPPITSLVVIYPSRGEFPPPGFMICKGTSDLNASSSSSISSRLCLCRGDGPPIVDLGLSPSWPVPRWRTIDQSPLGSRLSLPTKRGMGVAICVRYDLRDYRLLGLNIVDEDSPREVESTLMERGDSDSEAQMPLPRSLNLNMDFSDSEDQESVSSYTQQRKGSLVGQAIASALPLGRKLLQRGVTSTSQLSRRDSFTPDAVSTVNRITEANKQEEYSTRVQKALVKAAKQLGTTDDSAMFYDPDVVRLLAPSKDILRRVLATILACFDGTVQDSGWAMDALTGIISDGVLLPSTRSSQQVNLFDICLQAAADVVESGHAVLIASAVRLCVAAVSQANEGGPHILSVHYILISLCSGYDFFEHHREEAIANETRRPVSTPLLPSSQSSPPDTPMDGGMGHHPSSASLMTSVSQQDRDLLNSRNTVLKAGGEIFSDICRRAAHETVWWDSPGMKNRIAQFEAVIAVVNSSTTLRLEVACEIMLALNQVDDLTAKAPRAREVFFALAWLTVYCADGDHSISVLKEFLAQACDRLGEFAAFGYGVRRLVMPMLLDRLATSDPRKFNEAIELLSGVWLGFRKHLKAELAVVMSAVILPSLQDRSPTWRKLAVLQHISTLMDYSRSTILELFLNFENDSPVPHWKLFQDLIESMCTVAEPKHKPGMSPTAAQSRKFVKPPLKEASLVQSNALSLLATCLRHMVDLAGTVTMKTATGHGSWRNDVEVDERRDEERQRKKTLDRAVTMARASGARSAVNYLTAAGYVADSPAAIAQLLRVNQSEFGEDVIGDYLGEGGKTPAEQAFMVSVRDAYTRAAWRNAGDTFDEALRHFLTRGGFRLPGESQKVERLLEAFARRYARDNPTVCTEDAALVLAFSVVMLNTDLHRKAIKKSQKMKREQFVKNLSGVNRGGDFAREWLEELYDSVARNEIRFRVENKDEAESDEDEPDLVDDEDAFAELTLAQVQRGLGILSTLSTEFPTFHLMPSPESARVMFESTSAKFFALISSLLENEATEAETKTLALDMLNYSVTVTIFLNLDAERRAFASLLAKLVYVYCQGASAEEIIRGEHLTQQWFITVMDASPNDGDVGAIVALVHSTVMQLGDALGKHKQSARRAPLESLADRLGVNAEPSSPMQQVIKEGLLQVKAKDFSFVLFSDCLVRAVSVERKSTRWALRVIDNLPLRTLRVVNSEPTSLEFDIRSPVVNLTVTAASMLDKSEWIDCIEKAVRINLQVREVIRGNMRDEFMSPQPGERRLLAPGAAHTSSSTALRAESPVADVPPEDYAATIKAGKACLLDPNVDVATKMRLYGLFKQQAKGDCTEPQPFEGGDVVARAKWLSWTSHTGKSQEQARREFVALVLQITKVRCESEV